MVAVGDEIETAKLTTRRQWAGYAFVAIAAVAMALVMGGKIRASCGLVAIHQRKPMPLIELRQLDGGTWRLPDHHNKVVVVNYWATWCAPCWEETPALILLNEELERSGLAVVGVAMDEGNSDHVNAEIRRFVKTLHVSYPIALPERMSQMAYGMEGLPTTILVDRQGRVAKVYTGAIRESELRADIKTLLAEPALPSN
jgi:cytochrome c biogenesis protein CcmG/thiol:disulfide interchange protein DsbE